MVGTNRVVSVPSPSCPLALFPQQYAAPVERRSAHACPQPALIIPVSVVNPMTVVGSAAPVVDPLPNCPRVLRPQHCIA